MIIGEGAPKDSYSSLGASDEIELFSLVPDGLDCIAGVGRSHINFSRVNFPEHRHPNCIEIHYCLRGSLTFAVGRKTYRCMPGDVFLTQPKTPHRLIERKRGQRHYWILFRFPKHRGETVLGLTPEESDLFCDRIAAIDRKRFAADDRLRVLFQELFTICDNEPRDAFRTIKLKSVALTVLLTIIDCAEQRKSNVDRPVNERLQSVIRDMQRNPAQTKSIEELAQSAALSESRFSFLFKKATGLPPHSFIVSRRMDEAKRRLTDTDDPISKIAHDMGFASSRHLATQFRQFFGKTPCEFRTCQLQK